MFILLRISQQQSATLKRAEEEEEIRYGIDMRVEST